MTGNLSDVKIRPSRIVRHFSINLDDPIPPRSIGDLFLQSEYCNSLNMRNIIHSIQRLELDGILAYVGNTNLDHPIVSRSYISLDEQINRPDSEYDCLVGGWPEVVRTYENAVWRVEARHENGTPDVGTAFLAGNVSTLLTAKHVLNDTNYFKIIDPRGNIVIPKYARFFVKDETDIAAISIEQPIGKYNKIAFKIADHEIGEDVICLGFPVFPNFNEILIAERANVVATTNEYHTTKRLFGILSARLKGGNSGGPVVNRFGQAVGVISVSAARKLQNDEIEFGFGAFVPRTEILKLLRSPHNPKPDIVHCPIIHNGNGWWKLNREKQYAPN